MGFHCFMGPLTVLRTECLDAEIYIMRRNLLKDSLKWEGSLISLEIITTIRATIYWYLLSDLHSPLPPTTSPPPNKSSLRFYEIAAVVWWAGLYWLENAYSSQFSDIILIAWKWLFTSQKLANTTNPGLSPLPTPRGGS